MNIPPSSRQRQERQSGGKETNPDRIPVRVSAGDPRPRPAEPPIRALPSDEELLESYRQGRKGSFTQLVGRYQRELFHFLVRFLGDRSAAEDIFQETFLQVHQSAALFDTQRRFKPWLFTIAANKARDLMRGQARRQTTPLQASINPGDDDGGQFIDLMQAVPSQPWEALENDELRRAVHDMVMSMPQHLREILLFSYFHQFPYRQISEILHIPLGTVKSRLHAAVACFALRWQANQQGHSSRMK